MTTLVFGHDVVRNRIRRGFRVVLIVGVTASCAFAQTYEIKVASGAVPRSRPATVEQAVATHIRSRPDVYPPGSTHRIISMEWLPPNDEFRAPDGGGFRFGKASWAVTIDGPVRGISGEQVAGPLNLIMVDDASANVWGWTP